MFAAAGPTPLVNTVLQAGVYGATAMISCLMSHRLAFWARDYRLIAEKQQSKIEDLQEINNLIIRNMTTGVLAVDFYTFHFDII